MSHAHSTTRASDAATSRPETGSPRSWTAAEILAAGIGFGLVTGAFEAVAAAIRSGVMHVTVYVGPEAAWLLPLTDGFIFIVLGLALAALGAFWSALRTPRVVLGWFAGFLILALVMLTEKIHIAAEMILAAGLASGVARVLARRADAIRRGLRFGVPAGLGLVVLIGLGQWWRGTGAERRELAGAGPHRPNILLLVLDTVRAWNLSLYGYGRPTTPLLRQWAARGAVFERTLAPAPWTTLSHASMFTGRFPPELSVTWRRRYDGAWPTLADVLRQDGYATAGFAGNYLNLGRGTGLARGFDHYEDYPLEAIQLLRSTSLCFRLLRMDRVKELLGRRRNLAELPAGRGQRGRRGPRGPAGGSLLGEPQAGVRSVPGAAHGAVRSDGRVRRRHHLPRPAGGFAPPRPRRPGPAREHHRRGHVGSRRAVRGARRGDAREQPLPARAARPAHDRGAGSGPRGRVGGLDRLAARSPGDAPRPGRRAGQGDAGAFAGAAPPSRRRRAGDRHPLRLAGLQLSHPGVPALAHPQGADADRGARQPAVHPERRRRGGAVPPGARHLAGPQPRGRPRVPGRAGRLSGSRPGDFLGEPGRAGQVIARAIERHRSPRGAPGRIGPLRPADRASTFLGALLASVTPRSSTSAPPSPGGRPRRAAGGAAARWRSRAGPRAQPPG